MLLGVEVVVVTSPLCLGEEVVSMATEMSLVVKVSFSVDEIFLPSVILRSCSLTERSAAAATAAAAVI